MGGEYIDVIIFAAIAAILIFRLVSVLGKRTGEERSRDPFGMARGSDVSGAKEGGSDNVVPINQPQREPDATTVAPDTPLAAALTEIKIADKGFIETEFVAGAKAAFEMVITAYALGDTNTLKALLSDSVYANFENAINQRKRAGETQETTLVAIDDTDIIDAHLTHTVAQITVKFVSQQISVTRDEAGEAIQGDPDLVNVVTDIWTFSRDTRSKDPNWTLVETRSSN
jgi:predicted lipid-binding transport protein (Tim44 family)